MLINKKDVRRNKSLRRNQRLDKKENRDRKLDKKSMLKRNIHKLIQLSSEVPLGKTMELSKIDNTLIRIPTQSEFITSIKQAGLTGMSGNGFPVADKISTYLSSKAPLGEKTIIINAVECEPALLHDSWLLRNKRDDLIKALSLLKEILMPDRVILATRGKKEWVFDEDGLEVIRVPMKYPIGEEHILIHHLTGTELLNGIVPATKGILVLNIQTVYQMYRIINHCYDGGHYITLANLKTGEGRVAYVDDKVEITNLLEQAFDKQTGFLFAGGGISSAEEIKGETYFTNTTTFAGIVNTLTISNDNSCKKCGGCSKKCPVGISVKEIVLEREKNMAADIHKWKPERCIHCQTCTYYCIAGKDVSSYVSVQ